jgi:hypothetical protein
MSAYRNKFIATVKVNGQILREKDGAVQLPFNSEYSLLLKNLSTRRALVKISIDGKDVLNGRQLVFDPNEEKSIERFIDELDKGRKFRFVQKTKEIVEARGDRLDDGLVRVEFSYERIKPIITEKTEIIHHYDQYHPTIWPYYYPQWPYRPFVRYDIECNLGVQNFTNECNYNAPIGASINNVSARGMTTSHNLMSSTPAPEEGITVRGSESNQKFQLTYGFECDPPEEPIIIILRGYDGLKEFTKVVKKALTVKTKLKCPECGKSHKSHLKYCSTCGSALSLT